MYILAVNTGSSSIKVALFKLGNEPAAIYKATISHIGQNQSDFKIQHGGNTWQTKQVQAANHTQALQHICTWLSHEGIAINAIGHRFVHGGSHHHLPVLVTPQVLNELYQCTPFAPQHLPNALAAVAYLHKQYPQLPQVACFDTDFHWQMPEVAHTVPLPLSIAKQGVRKYGFHGLSYQYVWGHLQNTYPDIVHKKIVIAHLGSGASMVAIKQGKSIDTTMGFSPTGGLIMATRTGDLDPGILLYLLNTRQYSIEDLEELLNHQSGLKGISGISGDMQVLEHSQNANAELAVAMFCYQAKKHLGALIAALGGIDILAFTGGIGEASYSIREAICNHMGYAGIALNHDLNEQHAGIISSADSRTAVHIINTDEEYVIAQHTKKLLTKI